MTEPPTWTILVPTIPARATLFARLMDRLLPQLDAHEGRVTVLAWRNTGHPHLGALRDALVIAAPGEYVSFIDDDDLVPEYYVAEVVAALAGRPDHVGFQLEYTTESGGEQVGREIVDHSLRHGRWHRNAEGQLVRDFTHIDPLRRDIALRGHFGRAKRGRAEDRMWVKQLRGWLGTEAYIDKIMYHYLWSHEGSSWGPDRKVVAVPGPMPLIVHPLLFWHPLSDA
jgi:hypothetical protein